MGHILKNTTVLPVYKYFKLSELTWATHVKYCTGIFKFNEITWAICIKYCMGISSFVK